jgi:sigma-B regulation protein RsbU (phosphoserine phosphatase)
VPSCEDDELTTDAFYSALLDDNVEDLYENAPCGYLSTLPDGTIIKVNGTFLTWTGRDRPDLVGRRRFPQLLTAGGRIFYETHIAPMLRMQDRVREIAVEVTCADGRRLPVLVNAVLKRDELGEPLVVRIAVFDATERRSYEQELLRTLQRAEASEARARQLAQTLQASLIPPETAVVPGLDVAGGYRPAGAGDEVGGDFYDVFETGDGGWAVVLGDVCGKGAEAATVTALARYTARAAAMQDPSPAHVLRTLNAAIVRQHPDRFCTAVYVRVHPARGGRTRLTLCVGGHLLPLLAGPGRLPHPVGEQGMLIGAFPDVELSETTVTLAPHEIVLLYTDGIPEARNDRDGFYGDDRLAAALAEAAERSAHDIAAHLVTSVVDYQGGQARDDIAVVVLKAPPEDEPGGHPSVTTASHPSLPVITTAVDRGAPGAVRPRSGRPPSGSPS